MPSSGEDARKKREYCNEDETEKPSKKVVRSNHQASENNNNVSSSSSARRKIVRDSSAASKKEVPAAVSTISPNLQNDQKVWDVESALLYLVQMETNCIEYLTNDKSMWVTFRMGHAGDASAIASWYRQAKRMTDQEECPELEKKPARRSEGEEQEEETTSNMLEVWLADGMGDEGSPPSCYTLVAHVHRDSPNPLSLSSEESSSPTSNSSTSTKSLGAVVLLTVAYADNERILRVEWMGLDQTLPGVALSTLEQRTWLRLSTLSVMTACQIVQVDRQLTMANTDMKGSLKKSPSERLHPSAE